MILYGRDALRCNFVWASTLMMEEWTDLDISAVMMDQIIGNDFEDEWLENDYDPNSPYMDTCVRERVMDAVSMHLIGRTWPLYSENVDMSVFIANLQKAIELNILQAPTPD